jgi:chromosome segregation ATPase
MWISKEEYNQLKAERDFYEQQLKDWEQEWKNAYKETNPIDGKEKYKTTTDLENLEIKIPDLSWLLSPLVGIDSGYMEERDWIDLISRYEKELKSKNDDIEDLERCISEYERELDRKNELVERLEEELRLQKEEDIFTHMNRVGKELKSKDDEIENLKERLRSNINSYDNLSIKYDKMRVNLDAVKHDLFMSENEVSEVREALEHQAKRNNELFKLNERLCNKILELEKSNNDLKKEKTPVDYLKYYFLEDEVKQLVDLLEVALRDMTLRSTNTIYELQYDSFSHVYRILTTPKTK